MPDSMISRILLAEALLGRAAQAHFHMPKCCFSTPTGTPWLFFTPEVVGGDSDSVEDEFVEAEGGVDAPEVLLDLQPPLVVLALQLL